MTRRSHLMTMAGAFLVAYFGAGSASATDKEFTPRALGMKVPVLTRGEELETHVGHLVALRGFVTNTKLPTILAVYIESDDKLRGQEAYAVGILAKWTVTEEALRRDEEAFGSFQNDGPGVKYALYRDLEGRFAEAHPIPRTKPPQKLNRASNQQPQSPASPGQLR